MEENEKPLIGEGDLLFLEVDDHDIHDRGCDCGLCNLNGKSYGVAVRHVADPDGDPIERHYAASEESAVHNAKAVCEKSGAKVVDYDRETGYISGVVGLGIDALINSDLGSFLDEISDKLCGSDLLMDISYEVVGAENGEVLISVSGDPAETIGAKADFPTP